MDWRKRIVQDQNIHFGKPVIKGTRVTVSALVAAIASGDPIEQVAEDYGVSVDDVRAAIKFAVAHAESVFDSLLHEPMPRVVSKFGRNQVIRILRLLRGRGETLEHKVREALQILNEIKRSGLKSARQRFGHDNLREVLLVAAELSERVCEVRELSVTSERQRS
jgi:uncharacterized protein (DUF433 family)